MMLGTTGDIVMELGACWAIVMALTGYYLFIRGRAARLRRKITGAAGLAMRSRHAVIGSVVGVSLLILLVSGLPWTGFWGKHAQTMATDNSTSMWGSDPGGVSKPGLDPRRVAAAQPRPRDPVGPGRLQGARVLQARATRSRSPTSTPRSPWPTRPGCTTR